MGPRISPLLGPAHSKGTLEDTTQSTDELQESNGGASSSCGSANYDSCELNFSVEPDGTEEVLITGHELLVTVRDSRKRLHAFCHTGIPTDIEIHKLHHTQYLLNHFAIPDAPDITKVYPATYAKHRAFLSSL